jgi:hypothetical protein
MRQKYLKYFMIDETELFEIFNYLRQQLSEIFHD